MLALHFGQPFFELLDPHFIQRVGAQKPQSFAAAVLPAVFRETLPETDGSFRIVSGAGHVNQADHAAVPPTNLFHGKMKTHLCGGDKRLLRSSNPVSEKVPLFSDAVTTFCCICDKRLSLPFYATSG